MKAPKEKMVRVSPDSRDAKRDYWLPASQAQAQYDAGQLARDVTNSKPGEPVYTHIRKVFK